MLGVRLGEHVQLDVVRVATQLGERILQVVNFVVRQRQAKTNVGINQRLTALPQQIHAGNRCRLVMSKQFFGILQRVKYALHHAIVQFCRHRAELLSGQTRGINIVGDAAFQPQHLIQAAVMCDVGSFGRPGRDSARAGSDEQQFTGRGMAVQAWAILQQSLKSGPLIFGQRRVQVGKMDILGVYIAYREVGCLKPRQQFVNTKCRQCRRTTQNFHHKSLVFSAFSVRNGGERRLL